MTTETLTATRKNSPTPRDKSRSQKHLLWKDFRTFGSPAAVLVGAYFFLTLIAFAFSETSDEFIRLSQSILVFAWTGLSMLWATAAGAIVTAADREDGTDTWMRSLPVSPLRVYITRSAAAYISVLAIGLLCSIGLLWASTESAVAPNGGGFGSYGFTAVIAYLITAAAFLGAGLLAGSITGSVISGVMIGASIPIIAYLLFQFGFDTLAPSTSDQRFTVVQTVMQGVLAICAKLYAGRRFVHGVVPRLEQSSSNPHRFTGLRRWIAGRLTPNRVARSLVWREFVSLSWFLPWAIIAFIASLAIAQPFLLYVAMMTIPLAAGVASATRDSRDDSLPFLTNHGRSAMSVWFVKTATWGGAVFVLLIALTSIAEGVIGSYPDDRWQTDVDQTMQRWNPPSSVIATVYCSAGWYSKNGAQLVGYGRGHAMIAAVGLAGSLFLLGQLAGFGMRRRVLAIAVAAFAAVFWMFVHTVTAVLDTPSWALNVVPMLLLAIAAYLACRDALYQRNQWLRLGCACVAFTAVFVCSVRSARISTLPDVSVLAPVELLTSTRPPTAETAKLFAEVANEFEQRIVVPVDFDSSISKVEQVDIGPGYDTSFNTWLASPWGEQLFMPATTITTDDVGGDGDSDLFGFEFETGAEKTDDTPVSKKPNTDNRQQQIDAYNLERHANIASEFEKKVAHATRFADAIASNPDMPQGQHFRSFGVVYSIAGTLLIDAILHWQNDEQSAGWAAWQRSLAVTNYFCEHDGEWTLATDNTQISPASWEHANSMRLRVLTTGVAQLSDATLDNQLREEIRKSVTSYVPSNLTEITNAATRVLLAPADASTDTPEEADPRALPRFVDFYLANSVLERKSRLAMLAILNRVRDYPMSIELAAVTLGMSDSDIRRLGAGNLVQDSRTHSGLLFLDLADRHTMRMWSDMEYDAATIWSQLVELLKEQPSVSKETTPAS